MITNKKYLCSLSPELNRGFFQENVSLSDLLFFDIETTGLSPKNSHVFLIGLIQYSETSHCFECIQFLAENQEPLEEARILESFCRLAEKKSCLVHFNGTSFDLPYLRHRCQALNLPSPFTDCPCVDLYRELLAMPAFFRQMPDHKQKTFETLVNYPRTDQLSGKAMIKAFKEYAVSRSFSTLNLLFLHNEDDLKGMLALTALGSLKQLLQKDYAVQEVREIQEPDMQGTLKNQLLFTLSLTSPVPAHLSAHTGFCYITVLKNQAKIKMPLYEGTLRYFYADYKNYYYLPFEDEAIHKSVAAYLDSSHRKKATAATCYKKVSGQFLYAPGTPQLPILKENYNSKDQYVQWPFQESVSEHFESFLHEILKTAITQK